MASPNIEEFGRKVQRAQLEIQQVKATATSGSATVVVDSTGALVSVTSPNELEILVAYREARAQVDAKVKTAAKEVTDDPLAQTISGLVDAYRVAQAAVQTRRAEEDELEWESIRRDPLRRRRGDTW